MDNADNALAYWGIPAKDADFPYENLLAALHDTDRHARYYFPGATVPYTFDIRDWDSVKDYGNRLFNALGGGLLYFTPAGIPLSARDAYNAATADPPNTGPVDNSLQGLWNGMQLLRGTLGETALPLLGVVGGGAFGKRDIDPLGYYSAALEAARGIKQAKGPPEQMLRTLKNAGGVTDAEIQATGLDKFLEGKNSVTREDIIKYLDENRVRLRESDYARDEHFNSEFAKQMEEWRQEILDQGRFQPVSRSLEERWYDGDGITKAVNFLESKGVKVDRDLLSLNPQEAFAKAGAKIEIGEVPVWSDHDGMHVIIEAPDGEALAITEYGGYERRFPSKTVAIDELNDEGQAYVRNHLLTPAEEAEQEMLLRERIEPNDPTRYSSYSLDPHNPTYRETVLHLPEREQPSARDSDVNFRSGHFPEPNIVGHLMTSLVKDKEGRTVYNIDQIQSDWGQRLRDKGVRDEAKIAELRREIDNITQSVKNAINEGRDFLGGLTFVPSGGGPPLKRFGELRRDSDVIYAISSLLDREAGNFSAAEKQKLIELNNRIGQAQELERLNAELRTAEAAAPSNPLVNTTGQWVSTVLRRALRQAIESGADYIAIPSGKTVLSYNPGKEHGMQSFYDRIVPNTMKEVLREHDKTAPPPEYHEKLITPSGAKGKGFTVFPINDKIRQSVIENGNKLFGLAPLAIAGASFGYGGGEEE